MCLQTGHLHTLNAEAFTIVFTLSNTLLHWKAGLGPVPLLLRVTTGKQKSFIHGLQHRSSKASCEIGTEQNLFKMVVCPPTMGPQMMLHFQQITPPSPFSPT